MITQQELVILYPHAKEENKLFIENKKEFIALNDLPIDRRWGEKKKNRQ
jgi:hypothetical protein